MSLPMPSIRLPLPDDGSDPMPSIKSVIKGAQLHNMDLIYMLKYHATQMFIKTFDSVADEYPIDAVKELVKFSANYNNATVYKHLINRTKIDTACIWCDMVFFFGNVDILQTYLDATGHRPFPSHIVQHLPLVADSGSVEFARLLLQHTAISYDSGQIVCSNDFERRGVRVDMLRLFHEEFHILFVHTELWRVALLHSAKCNMLDSVQYILDNMPPTESESWDLDTCLKHCAKSGNAAMFQSLIKSNEGTKYLNNRDIRDLIDIAADRGHESFIKYLLQHHVGNGHINKNSEDLIRNLLEMPSSSCESTDINLAKLRITPMAAIRNDDIVTVESYSDHQFKLGYKVCREMSESMAKFISSPRTTKKLHFGDFSVLNMIKAVGIPGSNITQDIICQFIVNCNIKTNRHIGESMVLASRFSTEVMQLLNTHLKINYSECIMKVIKSRSLETIAFIFEHTKQKDLKSCKGGITRTTFKFVSKASLSEVTFLLGHVGFLTNGDVELCEWAALNPHVDVFEHVINQYTLEHLTNKVIDKIIDQALLSDRVDNVRMLQQRFELDPAKPLVKPTLDMLDSMVKANCYLTLDHYFNSTTFTRIPRTHQLRILHIIHDKSYQNATHRVIKVCIDHIKSLTHEQSQSQPVESKATHVVEGQVQQAHQATSSLMETAFHSVFNDTKLGMMVMEQIGRVHKSLGIDDKHLIKGSQLIDNHCLFDYIKYSATEWFLKFYSTPNMDTSISTNYNSRLLLEALVRCDTRAVDVLLANPKMRLLCDQFTQYYVWNIECTHPHWERMFDQFVEIISQTSPTIELEEEEMSKVRHHYFANSFNLEPNSPPSRMI
ncbi:hypothetical protein SAMD00019534_024790 [Acytostelium subglobosum LB1]|uniref:hypothetical protein n=1 Tax=Acytostelium subglobosum LB1 TaxID=1410327 RepID=UPI000644C4A8|nr:hypothetical protein SAMD00019534_024790 [Acytostelium subglobosum LB1]GAM19304.1 hypothetical protein SAMD00019534_024790 [Acytostelium subglobosum LB1]|eukprot:XP_012757231.1 hypothetical protein SAMD00019534_024790 [Acytostelium subglobosum LB1]